MTPVDAKQADLEISLDKPALMALMEVMEGAFPLIAKALPFISAHIVLSDRIHLSELVTADMVVSAVDGEINLAVKLQIDLFGWGAGKAAGAIMKAMQSFPDLAQFGLTVRVQGSNVRIGLAGWNVLEATVADAVLSVGLEKKQ